MRTSPYWHQYDAEDARIVFGDISERTFLFWIDEYVLEDIKVTGEIFSIALSGPLYVTMPVRIGLKEGLRCLEDAMLEPGETNG